MAIAFFSEGPVGNGVDVISWTFSIGVRREVD
jgi:hypothetical protein